MTDRPILFSAPMIRALLDGRKTQTRRTLKPQPCASDFRNTPPETARWFYDPIRGGMWIADGVAVGPFKSPAPGDRLWVKKGHAIVPATAYRMSEGVQQTINPADKHDAAIYRAGWDRSGSQVWRSPIFMPRWASRLTLLVTVVRVQRLQDINRGDAMEEGCPFPNMAKGDDPRRWYADLWNTINGPGAWEANPWIVAVTFTVERRNIDA